MDSWGLVYRCTSGRTILVLGVLPSEDAQGIAPNSWDPQFGSALFRCLGDRVGGGTLAMCDEALQHGRSLKRLRDFYDVLRILIDVRSASCLFVLLVGIFEKFCFCFKFQMD